CLFFLLFFSLIPLPPKSTLFPYTTLFRSDEEGSFKGIPDCGRLRKDLPEAFLDELRNCRWGIHAAAYFNWPATQPPRCFRVRHQVFRKQRMQIEQRESVDPDIA